MSTSYNRKDLERRMAGAHTALLTEFAGLRTGRASVSLLDPVQVSAYGQPTPLNQVATVSTPESRLISVQVWDKSMVGAVEKAVRDAGIGLNPVTDGQVLRIPIPPLNEERRAELAKLAGKYAEHARIAVRNVRRDGNDALKVAEKAGEISEDKLKGLSKEIQELTDQFIAKIDASLKEKEQDIMQV
jgi:ribosome recycling factor